MNIKSLVSTVWHLRKVDVKEPESWRKAIAAAIGAIVLAVGSQLGMDPEVIQWLGGLFTALILGKGVHDYITKMPTSTYTWRKVIAAVVGALVLALGPQIGIPEDTCQWIVAVIGGFIGGQMIADAKAKRVSG